VQGEQGPAGQNAWVILNGPVGLSEASVTVTDCPSSPQTAYSSIDGITLPSGTYRPVFVGNSLLGGTSSFVVQVLLGGSVLTEYSKGVSSQGTSEQTFQYVYLNGGGQLFVTAQATSSCGSASVSGAVAFEKVE
jgi:hypothetical protein